MSRRCNRRHICRNLKVCMPQRSWLFEKAYRWLPESKGYMVIFRHWQQWIPEGIVYRCGCSKCIINTNALNDHDYLRWRYIVRLKYGQSLAEVARSGPKVVSRLWNPFQTSGTVTRRVDQGRHRATKSAQDHYMALSARDIRNIGSPLYS
ncbi:hypothetical protein TNCV_919721 [Trichonephila clavipes]|nr:hypothetical protein TNCV_919721 [Trichonephila clavipes]